MPLSKQDTVRRKILMSSKHYYYQQMIYTKNQISNIKYQNIKYEISAV